ncbi:MAG: hypothetical protein QXS17_02270 [Candidatus Micrarchaeaceae archaeon]
MAYEKICEAYCRLRNKTTQEFYRLKLAEFLGMDLIGKLLGYKKAHKSMFSKVRARADPRMFQELHDWCIRQTKIKVKVKNSISCSLYCKFYAKAHGDCEQADLVEGTNINKDKDKKTKNRRQKTKDKTI